MRQRRRHQLIAPIDSEHSGSTARMERAGLVTPVHVLTVGPYRSTVYEVQVTL